MATPQPPKDEEIKEAEASAVEDDGASPKSSIEDADVSSPLLFIHSALTSHTRTIST